MIKSIGIYFVPSVLTLTALILLFSKKELFGDFLDGAKRGFETAVDILPVFVILMTAVGMFRQSGAMNHLCSFIDPLSEILFIPSEIIPLILMRPLSGSAATATVNELFANSGPDSFAGRCASVIMGASDTIIYTLTLYFGAAGIKNTRHAYPASILTMIFCTLFSVMLTKVFF